MVNLKRFFDSSNLGLMFLVFLSLFTYFIFSRTPSKDYGVVKGSFSDPSVSINKSFWYPGSILIAESLLEGNLNATFETEDDVSKITSYMVAKAKELGYEIESPLRYKDKNTLYEISLTESGKGKPVILEINQSVLVPTK